MTSTLPLEDIPAHNIEIEDEKEEIYTKVEKKAIPNSASWKRGGRKSFEERVEISPSAVSFGLLRIGYVYATSISLKNQGSELVKFFIHKPDTSFMSVECKNMTVGISSFFI